MYIFDRYLSPKIVAFCLAVALCCGCAAERKSPVGDGYVIAPVDEGNSEDVRWAEYLSGQIVRRSAKTDTSVSHRRGLEVRVHVDASLSHDFVVERKGEILHLSARDADKMLWLLYQFLSSRAGQGLDVADLPPAFVSMEGDCGDFAFEYRGIYTPSNSDPELMPVMASHNVDYDWALWGHNLRRVFDGGRIPDEARALVDGERAGSQFCFSSDVLFNAVSRFVKAHRSGDETSRFVIMPNDNGLVCQCPACVKAGNTPGSATPAVSVSGRFVFHFVLYDHGRAAFRAFAFQCGGVGQCHQCAHAREVQIPSGHKEVCSIGEPLATGGGTGLCVGLHAQFRRLPDTLSMSAFVAAKARFFPIHRGEGRVLQWELAFLRPVR